VFSLVFRNPMSGNLQAAVISGSPGSLTAETMVFETSGLPHTAIARLESGVDVSDIHLSISQSHSTLEAGRLIQVQHEVMLIIDVVGLTLAVRRGVEGSLAAEHHSGQLVSSVACAARRGDAQPLRLYAPAFVTAIIGQSSAFPSDSNTIYVTLASSIDFLPANNSKVTLTGLTGSTTPDSMLVLRDYSRNGSSAIFGSTGNWSQASGSLTLSLVSTLQAGTLIRFSFDLGNPPEGRQAAAVFVSASGSAALKAKQISVDKNGFPVQGADKLAVAMGPSTDRFEVQLASSGYIRLSLVGMLLIDDELMEILKVVDEKTALVARARRSTRATRHLVGARVLAYQLGSDAGDVAPFLVKPRSFIVRRIGQSSPYPAYVNSISVTLATNYVLMALESITLSGLRGFAAEDTSSLALSARDSTGAILDLFSSQATWISASSSVIFNVSYASNSTRAMTWVLEFSLKNKNPTGGRARSIRPVIDSSSGVYYASYLPDGAGLSSLSACYLVSGGLFATMYADLDLDPARQSALSADASIDFSSSGDGLGSGWPATMDPPSADGKRFLNDFSIRWQGYVEPPVSGVYTFQAEIADASDRVKIWVDNLLLVDQWASLAALSPAGTLNDLWASDFYSVKLEYRERLGDQAVSLKWSYGNASAVPIPSSRLFYTFNSQGSPETTLHVQPGVPCAARSSGSGTSLSLQTAGLQARFTMSARDAMGNLRRTPHDEAYGYRYKVQVKEGAGRYLHPNHQDLSNGRHVFDYTLTAAGVHSIQTFVAEAGGLHATYYATDELRQAVYVRADPNIDFSGAGRDAAPFDFPSTPSQPMDASVFSTRWHGFIRAQHAQTYTFISKFDRLNAEKATVERVRMWIDNALVIDQWSSLAWGYPTGTYTFDRAEYLYDVLVEFKSPGTTASRPFINLWWSSAFVSRVVNEEIVPRHRLYRAYHATGSPFEVKVVANRASPAMTVFSGDYGSGLYPYNVLLAMGVQLRDQFGNNRDVAAMYTGLHIEGFAVTFETLIKNYNEHTGIYDDGKSLSFGRVIHQGLCSGRGYCSNFYSIDFDMTGSMDLTMELALRGGLRAVYHRDLTLTSPVVDRVEPTVSMYVGRGAPPDTNEAVPSDFFSVRWSGYLRASVPSVYTFKVVTSASKGIQNGITPERYLKINNEVMRVTHVEKNEMGHLTPAGITIVRAIGGSTLAPHYAGIDIEAVLPIVDSPIAVGTLLAGSDMNSVTLDRAASSMIDVYAHAMLTIEHAFTKITVKTGTSLSSSVLSTYSSEREGELYHELSTSPVAGNSTYTLTSVPNAYFGRVADWTRNSGTLILSMSAPTTLAAAISSTATQVGVVDAASANIVMGSFVKVDRELLLVTTVTGNTLTVVRGMSQTVATSHSPGAQIASCLAPGKEYRLSFPLTNPATAQESPSVSISASGNTAPIAQSAAVQDSTSILGWPYSVAGDARPLKIYPVDFLIKDIGQSTSGPCPNYTLALWCFQDNTISLTLSMNHKLVSGSEITVNGLQGAQMPDTTDGDRVDGLTFGRPFTNLIAGMSADTNTSIVHNASAAGIVEGVYLRIDEELMLVRKVFPDDSTLDVQRGEGDTVPAPHAGRSVVITQLPIYDEPISVGSFAAISSPASFVLASTAVAEDGYYVGYVITVDWDGDRLTENDRDLRVITGYTAGRNVTLKFPFGQTPSSVSTYSISSRSSDLFGKGAIWSRSKAHLRLRVGGQTCGTTSNECGKGEPGNAALMTAIDMVETILVVSDALSGYIVSGSYIEIDEELMRVDNVTGNTLVVERSQKRTEASVHRVGAIVSAVLVPGQIYKLSFKATNPWEPQESPRLWLTTSGSVSAPSSGLQKDFQTVIADLGAVAGDAAPLKTIRGFVNQGKDIGQSTTAPGQRNTISVTLGSNIFLAYDSVSGLPPNAKFSKVTITGLTGSATPDSTNITIKDRPFLLLSGSPEAIDEGAPNTTFKLYDAESSRFDGAYVSFRLEMSTGSHPTETRTVVKYTRGRYVTVDRPFSVTPTTASTLRIFSLASASLNASATWTQSTGTLVLEVLSGRALIPNVFYFFTFNLTNPTDSPYYSIAQESPTVYISASGSATLAPTRMTRDTTTLLATAGAVLGDAMPLKLYRNRFSQISMGQNNPYPYITNTITVTFASNVAMDSNAPNALVIKGMIATTTSRETISITDVPLHSGSLLAVSDAATFKLDSNATSAAGVYVGYTITIGGVTATIRAYTGERLVTVSKPFSTSPSPGDSYSISAHSQNVLARNGSWDQNLGLLSLAVEGSTTLSDAVNATVVKLRVSNAAAAGVEVGAYIRIGSELMLIEDRVDNVLTVLREIGGTVAAGHAAGATVAKANGPGITYAFSFEIQNPGIPQSSPELILYSAVPLARIEVVEAGTGYISGKAVTLGGSGKNVEATFSADTSTGGGTGILTGFTFTNPGEGFVVAPNISFLYLETALSADMSDSDATMTVEDAASPGFAVGAQLQIDNEVVAITAIAGNVLTVTRAVIDPDGANCPVMRVSGACTVWQASHAAGAVARWYHNTMTNSITAIEILAGGSNYLDGDIRVTGGCDTRTNVGPRCKEALASFTVTGGAISAISVYDHGKDYQRDPFDDFDATYNPIVVAIYYSGTLTSQSDTIVDLTAAGGTTAGCSTSTRLYATGGGGYGFEAIVTAVNAGAIQTWSVANHGNMYTQDPEIVSSDASCTCDGNDGSVPGNMDACFTVVRAHGAILMARRAGRGVVQAVLQPGAIPLQVPSKDMTTQLSFPTAVPQPVPGDAAPLKVYGPQFSVRHMEHSSKYLNQMNRLSVTLAANFELTVGTSITISGLTGARVLVRAALIKANPSSSRTVFNLDDAASSTADAYVNYTLKVGSEYRRIATYSAARVVTLDSDLFSAPPAGTPYYLFLAGENVQISIYDGSGGLNHHLFFSHNPGGSAGTARWHEPSGTLTLHMATVVAAFTQIRFSFDVYNEQVQDSPGMTVQCNGQRVVQALQISTNGEFKALEVVRPDFLLRNAGQSNPDPRALNTITITLSSNIAFSADDKADLILQEFTGSSTDSTGVLALSDAYLDSGSLSHVYNESAFVLGGTESCSTYGCYSGYSIIVDLDGSDVTDGDQHVRIVSLHYGSGMLMVDAALPSAPTTSSTYMIRGIPVATFASRGQWNKDTGVLQIRPANRTNLAADVAAVDTSVQVADVGPLVVGCYIRINQELLRIDSMSANTLTVSRGRGKTLVQSHAAGSPVSPAVPPERIVKFSFNLVNNPTSQESPAVSVASLGSVNRLSLLSTGFDYVPGRIIVLANTSLPNSTEFNLTKVDSFQAYFSVSYTVVGATIATAGTGCTANGTLSVSENPGSGLEANFFVSGGGISKVTIVNGGAGYTFAASGTCAAVCECFGSIPRCSDGSATASCSCNGPEATIASGGGSCSGYSVTLILSSSVPLLSGRINQIRIDNPGKDLDAAPLPKIIYDGFTRCGLDGPLRDDCEQSGTVSSVVFTGAESSVGYVDGEVRVYATGTGAGFQATFVTSAAGAIDVASVTIVNHGAEYSTDAKAAIYYPGTDILMTQSISNLTIAAHGENYLNNGNLLDSGETNTIGFHGQFEVSSGGGIISTRILTHGLGYSVDPVLVPTYPVNTECALQMSECYYTPQALSITKVVLESGGRHYRSGRIIANIAVGATGSGFEVRFLTSDADGRILTVFFENAAGHGSNYDQDPTSYSFLYPSAVSCDSSGTANTPSTECPQDGTVSSVDYGRPFVPDAASLTYVTAAATSTCVGAPAGCTGSGFAGTCKIITDAPSPWTNPLLYEIDIINHGIGYNASALPKIVCDSYSFDVNGNSTE